MGTSNSPREVVPPDKILKEGWIYCHDFDSRDSLLGWQGFWVSLLGSRLTFHMSQAAPPAREVVLKDATRIGMYVECDFSFVIQTEEAEEGQGTSTQTSSDCRFEMLLVARDLPDMLESVSYTHLTLPTKA